MYLVYAISLFQGLRHGEDTQVGRVRQLLVQVIEMDIVVTYETCLLYTSKRVEIVSCEQDVKRVLAECEKTGKSVTFKAGGTSLSCLLYTSRCV